MESAVNGTGTAVRDMFYMGISLHAYQDSYSHRSWEAHWGHVQFDNPFWKYGDPAAKHADDQSFNATSQGWASLMAYHTYNYLRDWRLNRYPNLGSMFTWNQIHGKIATRIAMKGSNDAKNNAWKEQIWQDFKVKDLAYDANPEWNNAFGVAAALIPRPQ